MEALSNLIVFMCWCLVAHVETRLIFTYLYMEALDPQLCRFFKSYKFFGSIIPRERIWMSTKEFDGSLRAALHLQH